MTEEAATTDDRWIKAPDPLQLAIACGEDPVAFKGALAEYLRDGMLQARAKAVWTEQAHRICGHAHQQLKEEVGFDQFEGRSWTGLRRHLFMTVMAYAFLQT